MHSGGPVDLERLMLLLAHTPSAHRKPAPMIPPLVALLRLHEINASTPAVSPHAPRSRELVRFLQALTPEMHKRYVNSYTRHGHNAVAAIEHGACGGCHMRLPASPAEMEEYIYSCDHCGRLLYDRDEAFEYSVG